MYAAAQRCIGICTTASRERVKWHASFGFENYLLLNAEAPLSVGRRSLHDREILGIRNAIRHCIDRPDCGYAGTCFTPRQRCGAL
jgi:hypothetical protein